MIEYMEDKQVIASFTGHRPDKLGGYTLPNPTYIHISQQIKKALLELKVTKAISGMALGVDQYAANVCVQLGIPFVAAVPFIGQEKMWPAQSQKLYNSLLKKASEVVIVSEGGYSPAKMQVRNEWMVDNSDQVIAVWDGTPGGTANCVAYAKKIKKLIYLIDPKLLTKETKAQ